MLACSLSLQSEWQLVSSCYQALLSILADLNNAIVWIVLILALISNSFSPLFQALPSTLTTIGITVTLTFLSLFHSLARYKYLSIFLLFFILTQWSVVQNCKIHYTVSSFFFFFLLITFSSGLLARIRWSSWIPKSYRILQVLFSRTDSSLYR